jgi:hypothetical protein
MKSFQASAISTIDRLAKEAKERILTMSSPDFDYADINLNVVMCKSRGNFSIRQDLGCCPTYEIKERL